MAKTLTTITMEDNQFYPTPNVLAGKMLAGIDWKIVRNILEPSAGKGDLLKCAAKAFYKATRKINGMYHSKLEADCIELDPYLRQILAYNFTQEGWYTAEMREKYDKLDRMKWNENFSKSDKEEYKRLEQLVGGADVTNLRIVHDDFLTFHSHKRYNLILMNPPFANGDRHLLKALELQKSGGQIVCLLNAETLRNPYTNTRKVLQEQLIKYKAQISFIDDGFAKAERTARVDVAIVKVNIPVPQHESTIYERMKKTEERKNQSAPESTALIYGDFIEQLVQQFNIETSAGMILIGKYEALKPYMLKDIPTESNPCEYGNSSILTLSVGDKSSHNQKVDINKYLRATRRKYWRALLNNDKIVGRLTSELRKEYGQSVDRMADYDFSIFNIQKILAEINSRLFDGVKRSIMELFDELTTKYTWYPESSNNIHYFNGWKTNKAHKIGKKSIIPIHGAFSSYSWEKGKFQASNAYSVISDVEKVFAYLDGRLTESWVPDLYSSLRRAEINGCTRNVECRYFKLDFFKKGTVHIKYTDPEIIDRFNIYAAQGRNWLPPHYGKVNYDDLPDDEKDVVDSFQGKDAYAKIMENASFYLAELGNSDPMLLLSDSKCA